MSGGLAPDMERTIREPTGGKPTRHGLHRRVSDYASPSPCALPPTLLRACWVEGGVSFGWPLTDTPAPDGGATDGHASKPARAHLRATADTAASTANGTRQASPTHRKGEARPQTPPNR